MKYKLMVTKDHVSGSLETIEVEITPNQLQDLFRTFFDVVKDGEDFGRVMYTNDDEGKNYHDVAIDLIGFEE